MGDTRTTDRDARIDEVVGQHEPRWPAFVALIAVGGLYLGVPPKLTLGPRWLPLLVVTLLLIPTILTYHRGHHRYHQFFGHVVAAAVTLFLIISVVLLVMALGDKEKDSPLALLNAAISLWLTNVLVFALWYWRLDAGGPSGRDAEPGHTNGAFLFPQMTLTPEMQAATGMLDWSPHFSDYLFLAFNSSTAFSPTDTPVLSRWAKILMMVQSMISLLIVALLAARAINIL